MSSPIAIPRRAASPALSERSDSTTSSGLYVPVHKRGGSSSAGTSPVSSHRSLSPMSTSSSQPRKPRGQKRSKANNNSNNSASSPDDASKHTHIPSHNMIPTQYPNLPFVYPVAALLALSHAPATLSSEQLDSLREVNAFIPAASAESADKAAARRRRVGRQRKNTLSQPGAVAKAADVLARRVRQGNGTWGWNQYTSPEAAAHHQHDLETSWRHAPVVTITAAA